MSRLLSRLAATLLVATLASGLLARVAPKAEPAPEPTLPPAPVAPTFAPNPRFGELTHTVQRGEVLGTILPRYGIKDVAAVLAAAKPFTNLSRIRAGSTFTMAFERDVPHPLSLRLNLDEDRTLVIDLTGEAPTASIELVQYETRTETRVLTMTSSLWDAAIGAGLRPADVMTLANIFQWELDFNTELLPGATFAIVGEDLYREGEFVRAAAFHAVRLINGAKTYTAVQFANAAGKTGWYHPDGTGQRRPFLRSPLEFGRVTSGFGKRFHPILKTNRPHMGTDFGAAVGTPVRAVGDGVITLAGKNGGYGNQVQIDHEGPYASSYSHLSVIKVKNGQKVHQGDIVGLVGTTGLSTGPHLHYEVKVNGKQVDAMKVKFPTSEPLPAAEMAGFEAERDHWLAMLEPDTHPAPPTDALVESE